MKKIAFVLVLVLTAAVAHAQSYQWEYLRSQLQGNRNYTSSYTYSPPAPQTGIVINNQTGYMTPYTVIPGPSMGPQLRYNFSPDGRMHTTIEISPGMVFSLD